MNERIKELAHQSGLCEILNEHAGEFGNGDLTNTPYPELEKFAELIIRECSEIAMNNLDSPASAIELHFGVD